MTIRHRRPALLLLAALSVAAPATTTGQTRCPRGRSGADRAATSCPTARASPRPGRRAARRSCGAGASARGTRRSSSRTDVSTRCTGRSRASRRLARRSRRRPRCRDRQDDLGIQIPRAHRPASSSTRASARTARRSSSATGVRDQLQQRAVRARQDDRQAHLVARFRQGVQRAADQTRLQLQPHPLQRHHHRDDGRSRIRRWRPSISSRASCCGRAATSCGRLRRRFSSTSTSSRSSSSSAATS